MATTEVRLILGDEISCAYTASLAEVVPSQSCQPGAIGADMKPICIMHQNGRLATECHSEL